MVLCPCVVSVLWKLSDKSASVLQHLVATVQVAPNECGCNGASLTYILECVVVFFVISRNDCVAFWIDKFVVSVTECK